MDINFDNLRKHICYSHNKLVHLLNVNLSDDNEIKLYSDDVKELSEILEKLKMDIGLLNCIIDDEKGEFNYIEIELEEFEL